MKARLEQPVANSNVAGTRAGRGRASGSTDIEVHVAELRQMFDAMDPSPFHDRDLDPRAAEYIVGWARELPRAAPLALLVHLDRSAGSPDEAALLGDAIRQYFSGRSTAARQRLKLLFHSGRISLLIGLAFLAGAFATSQLIARLLEANGVGELLRESLLIGGWVAMWRPIEIFSVRLVADPRRGGGSTIGSLQCRCASSIRARRRLTLGNTIGPRCTRLARRASAIRS